MTLGYDINNTTDKRSVNNSDNFTIHHFDKYFFPESYSSEKRTFEIDDVTSKASNVLKETTGPNIIEKKDMGQTVRLGGPMDSPWPMQGHDIFHTVLLITLVMNYGNSELKVGRIALQLLIVIKLSTSEQMIFMQFIRMER